MTQEDSLLPFEQETLRRSRAVTACLEKFTAELAPRLGGAWSHQVLPTPYRWSHADDRLWEMEEGVLWRALHRDGDHQRARAFLTHAHGLQLYVMQRPHRPTEFLVGTLLPAGVYEYDTTPHPQAVSVPGDPARAAAAVRRRLLPYYRLASMRIASGTRFKQAQRVVIGRSTDGRPIADVRTPRAVRALLHEDGRWHLDPGTGLCVTATDSPKLPRSSSRTPPTGSADSASRPSSMTSIRWSCTSARSTPEPRSGGRPAIHAVREPGPGPLTGTATGNTHRRRAVTPHPRPPHFTGDSPGNPLLHRPPHRGRRVRGDLRPLGRIPQQSPPPSTHRPPAQVHRRSQRHEPAPDRRRGRRLVRAGHRPPRRCPRGTGHRTHRRPALPE